MTVFLSHVIHQNFDSLERITTKDYTVILDGEETQAELFVKFLKDFPNPYGYTYKIRDMRVKSDCNSAFLHFNFIEYLPDSGLVIKQ